MSDGGGSSGSSQPTSQTITQSNIPEYVRPYYETLLGQTAALTNLTNNPYQVYGGQRVAGFSPMQQQGLANLQGMTVPQQTTDASNMAAGIGQQALNYQNYNPANIQAQQVTGAQMSYSPQLQNFDVTGAQNDWAHNPANSVQNFQMGSVGNVGTDQFRDSGMAQSYMSPYIQNALNPVMDQMQRMSDLRQRDLSGQAQQAGGYGGYRFGLQQAEEQRNTERAKGDQYAQGMQSAFGAAQNAYATDRARMLQADLANQNTAFNTGAQNLNANLQTQGLRTNAGLQAMLANQQAEQGARLANQQGRYGTQQFGAQMGWNTANQNAQMQQQAALANQGANLQAQQASEQSRQFGSNLGLQGLNASLGAAGMLGSLGNQQFQQQLGLNAAQMQGGAMQQQQVQQTMNNQYQDWLNQQNWPYRNLSFMSELVGRPITQQTQQQYQAPPTGAQSMLGLGLGAYGLGRAFGWREGGVVKAARGGEVGRLTDAQLQKQLQNKQGDPFTLLQAAQEQERRGAVRRAMPVQLPPNPAFNPEQSGVAQLSGQWTPEAVAPMAKGGVVGFAEGDVVGAPISAWENLGRTGMDALLNFHTLKPLRDMGEWVGRDAKGASRMYDAFSNFQMPAVQPTVRGLQASQERQQQMGAFAHETAAQAADQARRVREFNQQQREGQGPAPRDAGAGSGAAPSAPQGLAALQAPTVPTPLTEEQLIARMTNVREAMRDPQAAKLLDDIDETNRQNVRDLEQNRDRGIGLQALVAGARMLAPGRGLWGGLSDAGVSFGTGVAALDSENIKTKHQLAKDAKDAGLARIMMERDLGKEALGVVGAARNEQKDAAKMSADLHHYALSSMTQLEAARIGANAKMAAAGAGREDMAALKYFTQGQIMLKGMNQLVDRELQTLLKNSADAFAGLNADAQRAKIASLRAGIEARVRAEYAPAFREVERKTGVPFALMSAEGAGAGAQVASGVIRQSAAVRRANSDDS